jgi:hypothetical protein
LVLFGEETDFDCKRWPNGRNDCRRVTFEASGRESCPRSQRRKFVAIVRDDLDVLVAIQIVADPLATGTPSYWYGSSESSGISGSERTKAPQIPARSNPRVGKTTVGETHPHESYRAVRMEGRRETSEVYLRREDRTITVHSRTEAILFSIQK